MSIIKCQNSLCFFTPSLPSIEQSYAFIDVVSPPNSALTLVFVPAESALIPFDEWPHQRVALNDVNIHFRYAGKGPPILLIHGVPEHSVSFCLTTTAENTQKLRS